MENMKVIPNTNERYYATVDGEIYDDKRKCFLAQYTTKKGGYKKCHVWYNGVRKTINVHRLVMFAYYGESNLSVNHKDGNTANNNIDNLEYMTLKEQNYHRSFILKKGNRKKVKCLENNCVYETINDACRDLNLPLYLAGHISRVCNGTYGFKSVKGYHFEYYK